jgi:hypothetical protein
LAKRYLEHKVEVGITLVSTHHATTQDNSIGGAIPLSVPQPAHVNTTRKYALHQLLHTWSWSLGCLPNR